MKHREQRFTRLVLSGVVLGGLVAAALAAPRWAQAPRRFSPPAAPESLGVLPAEEGASVAEEPREAEDETRELRREGDRLEDVLGRFASHGGRLTFAASDGGPSLVALENLMLQRVADLLDERDETLLWSVSGQVTEFRGRNYLLITRAVLKSSLGQPRAR